MGYVGAVHCGTEAWLRRWVPDERIAQFLFVGTACEGNHAITGYNPRLATRHYQRVIAHDGGDDGIRWKAYRPNLLPNDRRVRVNVHLDDCEIGMAEGTEMD